MAQYGFYYDMTACIGCRTCQIACKDKNDLNTGTIYRQVRTFETGAFPSISVYHYSYTCNHCKDAKCVKGCPTGAMHYGEDGTVQPDKDKCIGCKYCMWNCPYGVPQFIEEEKVIGKCDSCVDLRKQGLNPACVDACPMRVIHFGDLDELKKEFGDDLTSDLPILPASSISRPSLLIKAKNSSLSNQFRETKV